jgi:hypothetical protein
MRWALPPLSLCVQGMVKGYASLRAMLVSRFGELPGTSSATAPSRPAASAGWSLPALLGRLVSAGPLPLLSLLVAVLFLRLLAVDAGLQGLLAWVKYVLSWVWSVVWWFVWSGVVGLTLPMLSRWQA